MGIRILKSRYRVSAPAEGCRWCGHPERRHDQRWVPGAKWHLYVVPTAEQIVARMRALRAGKFLLANNEPTASPTRTQV